MIKMQNVKKNFGKTEVLKDISLNINEGEIYGLIGHSGAGKSTLLRCINALEDYNDGSVEVMGKEVKDLSEKGKRELRKELGMIFQGFNLLNRKNVFKNVSLPLEVWGYDKAFINKRVNELLEIVGLSEKAKSKPSELSGGQKQRVAIARALALEPKILLCDEATSALDPKTTKDILSLLDDINKKLGITIVVVTHQMEVVKQVCQRVALLQGGILVAEGRAEEVFLRPEVSLKKFLGEVDDDTLPTEGINIKLFFPSDSSENALITKMARELNIDFSIVGGNLEKFRDKVLGTLTINIDEKDRKEVMKYLSAKDIILEVL
ncbi:MULTISPECIES: methionine ABC transporter ATP-binding protein [unclassified Clostridium]|uniref:methionine ABC transporter ATP-binding protein n=1 Tax=Clostridium TaxID=1485 RepID=UPI001C8CC08C|nr:MULTISPECIES: methionine ABC transporter ATP-binding protein [unclassified Clostridium]MBX9138392.1 methionine ABC transporter ATP-binding protein [Clostridium sp. K12(2020)]MBX9145115.1 methionine ABC transporter ATP-binding protein [Clostridium sp. K13]MDU2290412.1 methionine ABC transporter ATP-binding protein [Clostridium celatum]